MDPLFAKPEYLLLGLLAVAGLGFFLYATEKRAWKRLRIFAESGLLDRLTRSHSRRRLWLKNSLLITVVLLLFISLARPQWGANWETAETRGIDIMIALDTSTSMLAEDISPNRLERSKLAILDLLDSVRGDRVGLIAFAGNAFLQCPLTLDYQAFRQTLRAVDTNTIPVGGTDVAAAIEEAEAYFEGNDNERILILITDGEDLEASGISRAREAAAKGTRILTVGVGSPEGELIPVYGPGGTRDYLRDASGNPVSTRLDESTLRRIAEATSGMYAPLGPTGAGLDQVYAFSLTQMPAEDRQEALQRIPIERFRWPLVLALVLLLAESLLTTRRRDFGRNGPNALTSLLAAALLSGLFFPGQLRADSARDASRAYKDGRFEESVSLYSEALQEEPENPRYLFNRGVSAYRADRFEEAIASFEQTLREAGTGLQAKSFHNLGNSRVAMGFQLLEEKPSQTKELWEAALADYQNALSLDEGRRDSRQNLDQLQATIEAHTYDLVTEAQPPEGGEVTPGGRSFHKIPFAITAKAADGYVFDSWQGEGVEDPDQPETVVRLEQDTSVAAIFAKTWNLTVLSEDETMGTAGESGTYREDEPVKIKAEAKNYYAFSRWQSEEVDFQDPTQAEVEISLTADSTVMATFVPAFKLSVEIDPEIGGKAGPSGFFEEYSVVPITAEPRPGFEWENWVGDGIKEPENKETSITMTGDRLAIAKMKRIWNLVIIPQAEEGGTVEGAGNHPVGSTVDISATPNEGFTFQGWEGPGVEDPASPQTRVTVQSTEHTLIARFQQDDQDNQDNQDQQQNQDQQNQDQNQQDKNNQQDQQQDQNQQQDQQDQEDQQNQDQQEQEDQQEQNQDQDQEQEQEQGENEEQEPPQEEQQEGQQPQGGEQEEEQMPVAPGEMTREEARQLLNALSESEKYLPAGERSREQPAETRTGRNW